MKLFQKRRQVIDWAAVLLAAGSQIDFHKRYVKFLRVNDRVEEALDGRFIPFQSRQSEKRLQ